jgi:hypothetical protein
MNTLKRLLIRAYQDLPIFCRKETYKLLWLSCLPSNRRLIREENHLKAALQWLLRSHQACRGKGFSIQYSLRSGWDPPYIETTGYIIPTLLSLRQYHEYWYDELEKVLKNSGEWLLNVQYRDGSYGSSVNAEPLVFDTGQAIFGLLALYQYSQDQAYLDAACRAGHWIASMQESDGSFRCFAYKSIPHTYYARVSWGLLKLFEITNEIEFKEAAQKQLIWVLDKQQNNGFFRYCSFVDDEQPVLHVIAYTIRGLWESGLLLQDQVLKDAALKTASILEKIQRRDGVLYGYYSSSWKPASLSHCLVGLAQMAGI